MKRLLVANMQKESGRYNMKNISTLLMAQIENSLDFLNRDDIIALSNFDFAYMGVKCHNIIMNDFCFTGSKMFGIKWLFDNMDCDIIWSGDLDCWQDTSFKSPVIKDVGATRYYNKNYNGGSIFWKRSAKDIIEKVLNTIIENKEKREEPALNKILKSKEYKDRITTIDSTYNLGCTGFAQRYFKSMKPVHCYHFHPYNRIAWETCSLDRSEIGEGSISKRLEIILRKYYPNLADKLKGDLNEKTREKIRRIKEGVQSLQKRSPAFVSNIS